MPNSTALNPSLLPSYPPPAPFLWLQTNPQPPENSPTLALTHRGGAIGECGHNSPATTTHFQAQPAGIRGPGLVLPFRKLEASAAWTMWKSLDCVLIILVHAGALLLQLCSGGSFPGSLLCCLELSPPDLLTSTCVFPKY